MNYCAAVPTTELPHKPPSVELINQSVHVDLHNSTTPGGQSVHHSTGLTELRAAVFVCIVLALALFAVAAMLSVVIAVLVHKRRKILSLERAKQNQLQRDSDDIWSTSIL